MCEKVKEYKELLDEGLITKEGYDEKEARVFHSCLTGLWEHPLLVGAVSAGEKEMKG